MSTEDKSDFEQQLQNRHEFVNPMTISRNQRKFFSDCGVTILQGNFKGRMQCARAGLELFNGASTLFSLTVGVNINYGDYLLWSYYQLQLLSWSLTFNPPVQFSFSICLLAEV